MCNHAAAATECVIRPVMKKLLLLTLLCWQVAVAGGEELPVEVDYNFHIKPILSDRCYRCHGPDATARQADLRLDLYAESLLTAGQGRAIIEPGSPQQSELYRRVASTDPQLRMPPDGAKLPPSLGTRSRSSSAGSSKVPPGNDTGRCCRSHRLVLPRSS